MATELAERRRDAWCRPWCCTRPSAGSTIPRCCRTRCSARCPSWSGGGGTCPTWSAGPDGPRRTIRPSAGARPEQDRFLRASSRRGRPDRGRHRRAESAAHPGLQRAPGAGAAGAGRALAAGDALLAGHPERRAAPRRGFARAGRAGQGGGPRDPHPRPARRHPQHPRDRPGDEARPAALRGQHSGRPGEAMALGRMLLAWVAGDGDGSSGWDADRAPGTTEWPAGELGLLAGGEALLLTLFGALWFGSLGAGAWWLVFGLVGGAPRVADARESRRRGARGWRGRRWRSGWCGCCGRRGRRHPGLAPGCGSADESGARSRLALYFGAEPSRPAILARLALGRPAPRRSATSRWSCAARLAGELRPDGSVRGGLGARRSGGCTSCWTWASRATAARSVPPLPVARRAPGSERRLRRGMRQATARQRVCEHFLVGFFSPAPPEQRLAPITLPNGKVFRAEPAARFALSCARAPGGAPGGRIGTGRRCVRHLESLAGSPEQWTGWASCARARCDRRRHARAGGGRASLERREPRLVAGGGGAAGSRTAGGSDADLFPMLDMLLAAGELPTR